MSRLPNGAGRTGRPSIQPADEATETTALLGGNGTAPNGRNGRGSGNGRRSKSLGAAASNGAEAGIAMRIASRGKDGSIQFLEAGDTGEGEGQTNLVGPGSELSLRIGSRVDSQIGPQPSMVDSAELPDQQWLDKNFPLKKPEIHFIYAKAFAPDKTEARYYRIVFLSAILIGGSSVIPFFGPFVYKNKQTGAERVLGILSGFLANAVLNIHSSVYSIESLVESVKTISGLIKQGKYVDAATSIVDLLGKVGFSYIAAALFSDLTSQIPWPYVDSPILKALAFNPGIALLNYRGFAGLTDEQIKPAISAMLNELRLLSPTQFIRDKKKTILLDQFKKAYIAAFNRRLTAAARSNAAITTHSDIITAMKNDDIVFMPHWSEHYTGTGLSMLFLLAMVYSTLGFDKGVSPDHIDLSDGGDWYKLLVAIGAIGGFFGLSMIFSFVMGETLQQILYDKFYYGNSIIGDPRAKKFFMGIAAAFSVVQGVIAYFSSIGSLDQNETIAPLVSRGFFQADQIDVIVGTMAFNSFAMLEITMYGLMYTIQRKFKIHQSKINIFVDHWNKCSPEKKWETIKRLYKAYEDNPSEASSIQRELCAQFSISPDQLNTAFLHAVNDQDAALFDTLVANHDPTTATAGWKHFARYFIFNTTTLGIAHWFLQSVLRNSMDTGDDSWDNLLGTFISYVLVYGIAAFVEIGFDNRSQSLTDEPNDYSQTRTLFGNSAKAVAAGTLVQSVAKTIIKPGTGYSDEDGIDMISTGMGIAAAAAFMP